MLKFKQYLQTEAAHHLPIQITDARSKPAHVRQDTRAPSKIQTHAGPPVYKHPAVTHAVAHAMRPTPIPQPPQWHGPVTSDHHLPTNPRGITRYENMTPDQRKQHDADLARDAAHHAQGDAAEMERISGKYRNPELEAKLRAKMQGSK